MRTSFVCSLFLLLVVSSAWAEEPKPPTKEAKAEAKKLSDEGTKFFNVQQYDKAAEAYQQAYLLDPKPGYLYASAQAQRLGGQCDKALLSYDAYLRTNPAEAERAKAQANIDRCRQEIKDREAAVEASQVAPPPDVPTPPPPPPAPEPVEPPPPPPPPTKSYVIGHLLVGVGVAALAGGVYLFQDGRSTINEHNDAPTYQQFLATREDMDAAKQKQTIGVAAIAGGTALLAGGIIYYVVRARAPLEEPAVSATVTTQQAMLFYGRAF